MRSRLRPRAAGFKRCNHERGLTLIEIMVVLIILGIVMTWLGSRLFQAGDTAKRRLTELKIKEIGSQIGQFQLQYNTLPSGLEDLTKCTERTGSNCIPITKDENLTDAWGNRFLYSLEDGGRRYKITSYGADGKAGGEGVDGDPFGTGP